MYVNLENARNLTYKAAWLCDHGQPYHLEATMAKLVAAEGARQGRVPAVPLPGTLILLAGSLPLLWRVRRRPG